MTAPTFKPDDIELIPDAWERFERATDAVVKGGPQHRVRTERTVLERMERLAKEVAALPTWTVPQGLEQPLKPRTPFS